MIGDVPVGKPEKLVESATKITSHTTAIPVEENIVDRAKEKPKRFKAKKRLQKDKAHTVGPPGIHGAASKKSLRRGLSPKGNAAAPVPIKPRKSKSTSNPSNGEKVKPRSVSASEINKGVA